MRYRYACAPICLLAASLAFGQTDPPAPSPPGEPVATRVDESPRESGAKLGPPPTTLSADQIKELIRQAAADQVIAYIDQGGLTLPDRDYYIKDDPKQVEMRKNLTEYITQVFTLAGKSADQAAESAKTVLRIETALAKAEMDRTLRRDPKNRDHKMKTDEATALAPNFYLTRYFKDVNAPAFSDLNVANPDFFKQVNGVIEGESLDSLKTYATWHVLHAAAPWLSKPFVDANFKLTQALTGQGEIQARWKRCIDATDGALGEALV
jgi:putative endopeptidase